MAVDPDTLALYDPQLAALKASVAALEAASPTGVLRKALSFTVTYDNGDVETFNVVP